VSEYDCEGPQREAVTRNRVEASQKKIYLFILGLFKGAFIVSTYGMK